MRRLAITALATVAKFNADLNAILRTGALDKQFAAAGSSPVIQSPQQAQAFIETEFTKWAAVIKAANIKAE